MKVIKVDGTLVPLPAGTTFKQVQEAVGGDVEIVPFRLMVANENGIAEGLLLNPTASVLAGRPLVGDVVLFDSKKEMDRVLGAEDD